MRRFFIKSIPEGESLFQITGQDAKHMRSVLRLKPSEEILLVDGTGNEFLARIDAYEDDQVVGTILEKIESQAESPLQITAAIGFLKEKKMDGLVRQLTELGVTKILPYFAERSIPRPSQQRLKDRKKRWERIARESIKQCRRGKLLEILFPPFHSGTLGLFIMHYVKMVFLEAGNQLFFRPF